MTNKDKDLMFLALSQILANQLCSIGIKGKVVSTEDVKNMLDTTDYVIGAIVEHLTDDSEEQNA